MFVSGFTFVIEVLSEIFLLLLRFYPKFSCCYWVLSEIFFLLLSFIRNFLFVIEFLSEIFFLLLSFYPKFSFCYWGFIRNFPFVIEVYPKFSFCYWGFIRNFPFVIDVLSEILLLMFYPKFCYWCFIRNFLFVIDVLSEIFLLLLMFYPKFSFGSFMKRLGRSSLQDLKRRVPTLFFFFTWISWIAILEFFFIVWSAELFVHLSVFDANLAFRRNGGNELNETLNFFHNLFTNFKY